MKVIITEPAQFKGLVSTFPWLSFEFVIASCGVETGGFHSLTLWAASTLQFVSTSDGEIDKPLELAVMLDLGKAWLELTVLHDDGLM